MQWREASRRRQRQTNQHHDLVPTPPPPLDPPPPQTKVTIVGNNEILNGENLMGPSLVPPPPSPFLLILPCPPPPPPLPLSSGLHFSNTVGTRSGCCPRVCAQLCTCAQFPWKSAEWPPLCTGQRTGYRATRAPPPPKKRGDVHCGAPRKGGAVLPGPRSQRHRANP